jgi:TonB family protein
LKIIQLTVAVLLLVAYASALAGNVPARHHAVPSGCAPPVFPAGPIRPQEMAVSVVELLIDAKGSVRRARIAAKSGYRSLDQAALEGLRRCIYTPSRKLGHPVGGWVQVRYEWTLD